MGLVGMCVQGSAMALAVIALRALLHRRLPATAFYALWALVLLRLLVPFALSTPLGVWPAGLAGLGAPAEGVTSLAGGGAPQAGASGAGDAGGLPGGGRAAAAGASTAPAAAAAPGGDPAGPAPPLLGELSGALPWRGAWAVGSLACGAALAVAYVRGLRRLSRAEPVADLRARGLVADLGPRRPVRVRSSPHVRSPLTYGALRPVVVVPRGFDWGDRARSRAVMAHELAHVRRLDAALKLAWALACCLYWFDPLVWAAARLADRDTELSCDELAVRRLGEEGRAAYAHALIDAAAGTSRLVPALVARGTKRLEERIMAVVRDGERRVGVPAVLATVALCLAVFVPLASTGMADDGDRAGEAPAAASQAGDEGTDGQGSDAPGDGTPAGAGVALVSEGASTSTPGVTYDAALGADADFVGAIHVEQGEGGAPDTGTFFTAPHYVALIPDEALPEAGLAWGFSRQGSEAVPAGATDVLTIADAKTGRTLLSAYCVPLGGEAGDLGNGFVTRHISQTLEDSSLAIEVAYVPGAADALADFFGPGGSLVQVMGLGGPGGGPASPDAYQARASWNGDGSVTILTSVYSVRIPAEYADRVSNAFCLGGGGVRSHQMTVMLGDPAGQDSASLTWYCSSIGGPDGEAEAPSIASKASDVSCADGTVVAQACLGAEFSQFETPGDLAQLMASWVSAA